MRRAVVFGIAAALASIPRLASAQGAPAPISGGAEPPATRPGAPAPPRPDDVDEREEQPIGPRQVGTQPSLATRLTWRWPEFRGYQYGLLIGQVVGAVAGQAIPGGSRLSLDNGFDDLARDAFRVTTVEGSRYARDASDVGLVLLLNQRFVDNLFVTWWYHDKGSTAWQMTLIDAQTISFTASVQSLVAGIAGRERPYAQLDGYCHRLPERATNDCEGSNRYRSFFSGHAALSFSMASLTCVHHINLPLYGGGPAEAVPCVTSMLMAGGVAMLRVASDQHHMTDVLTGAAFGTAAGFAIPYLFHYMHDEESPLTATGPGGAQVSILPLPTGLTAVGEF